MASSRSGQPVYRAYQYPERPSAAAAAPSYLPSGQDTRRRASLTTRAPYNPSTKITSTVNGELVSTEEYDKQGRLINSYRGGSRHDGYDRPPRRPTYDEPEGVRRGAVVHNEALRTGSPARNAPRHDSSYYVNSASSVLPRDHHRHHHRQHSIDNYDRPAPPASAYDVEKDRRKAPEAGYDRPGHRDSISSRTGRPYHLSGPAPRGANFSEHDGYEHITPRGMFEGTEPVRRRRGSVDTANRERPASMIDSYNGAPPRPRDSGGPPPTTRGLERIDSRPTRAGSLVERERHATNNSRHGSFSEDDPPRRHADTYPARTRYSPPRDQSADSYDSARPPRHVEDKQLSSRGFGIRPPTAAGPGDDEIDSRLYDEPPRRYLDYKPYNPEEMKIADPEPPPRDRDPEAPKSRRVEPPREYDQAPPRERDRRPEPEKYDREREMPPPRGRPNPPRDVDYDRDIPSRRERDYDSERDSDRERRERERERDRRPRRTDEDDDHPSRSGGAAAATALAGGAALAYGLRGSRNDKEAEKRYRDDDDRDAPPTVDPSRPERTRSEVGREDRPPRDGIPAERLEPRPRSEPPDVDRADPSPPRSREKDRRPSPPSGPPPTSQPATSQAEGPRPRARTDSDETGPRRVRNYVGRDGPAGGDAPPASEQRAVDPDEDFRRRMKLEMDRSRPGTSNAVGSEDDDDDDEEERKERELRRRSQRDNSRPPEQPPNERPEARVDEVKGAPASGRYEPPQMNARLESPDSIDGARRGGGGGDDSKALAVYDDSVDRNEILDQPMVQEPAEVVDGSRERRVMIVEPPKANQMPKGILKRPTQKFPEDPNPVREGVAPLGGAKKGKDIPEDARWTKIDRKLVNPAALEQAGERFEERENFVIVLRVLTKEEIQKLADKTAEIRGMPIRQDHGRSRDEDDPERHHRRRHRHRDDERDERDDKGSSSGGGGFLEAVVPAILEQLTNRGGSGGGSGGSGSGGGGGGSDDRRDRDHDRDRDRDRNYDDRSRRHRRDRDYDSDYDDRDRYGR